MTVRDLAVLLTVYAGVEPEHLREALDSIAAQTRLPDQLVVVADGPLTPGLEVVLRSYTAPCDAVVVRMPVNLGSGPASETGMHHVSCTWTARADADDVSEPHRFERQLQALDEAEAAGNPLDVVGADMTEFSDDPPRELGVRRMPRDHDEIGAYLRLNNPVNNPTLLVRTECIRRVGGYRDVPFMEDYDLMARLWAAGCRFANVPEPLVRFRMSGETLQRRTGRRVLQGEWQMQRNLRSYGITRPWQRYRNLALRVGFRLLPDKAMTRAYDALFRR